MLLVQPETPRGPNRVAQRTLSSEASARPAWASPASAARMTPTALSAASSSQLGESLLVALLCLDKDQLARAGTAQDPHGTLVVALADRFGEARDLRAGSEAMTVLEHHDPACEGAGRRPRRRRPDDLAEHGSRLHARQLEGVAHEDQRGIGTDSVEQPGHERQRHHRRLVHYHEVVGQPVEAVEAGAPGRADPEQSVERPGSCGAHRLRDLCEFARDGRLLHLRLHAGCGLARRGCEGDAQLSPLIAGKLVGGTREDGRP